jgi:hypothetical protein
MCIETSVLSNNAREARSSCLGPIESLIRRGGLFAVSELDYVSDQRLTNRCLVLQCPWSCQNLYG